MSKLKKPNTITMATSYLMLNELNNLGNEIFHSVNQLKVWKKRAIRLIRPPAPGPHVLITFTRFLEI